MVLKSALSGSRFSSLRLCRRCYDSSCCAATAANIANMFGMKKTEKEMAELFATTVSGTSPAQVIFGMEKLGFRCKKVNIEDADAKKLNPPAIIMIDHIEAGPEAHAVGLMKRLNGKVEIWDPLRGRSTPDVTKVKKYWHGKAIEVSR